MSADVDAGEAVQGDEHPDDDPPPAGRNAGRAPSFGLHDLDREIDNIDAALAWTGVHDPTAYFELAGRLGWFWFWTGRTDVGWRTVSASLELGPEAGASRSLRARTLAWAGMLGAVHLQAMSLMDQGVEEARASGHGPSVGCAVGIRAALLIVLGQPGRALADIDEADACYAGTPDLHAKGMMSMVRGIAAVSDGRFDDAEMAYCASIDHLRKAGDEWAAGFVYQRMAELAERRGDFDGAASALEAAVLRAGKVPNRSAQALLERSWPRSAWARADWRKRRRSPTRRSVGRRVISTPPSTPRRTTSGVASPFAEGAPKRPRLTSSWRWSGIDRSTTTRSKRSA